MRNPEIILSPEQSQILNGCLLGDGWISKKNFDFGYLSSKLDHVECIFEIFREFIPKRYKNGPKKYSYFDKRYEKTYTNYSFYTQRNITFLRLRQKWYPQDKKIVPRDLRLSPLTCLWWYIGDGTLNPTQQYILLYTNGFEENDVNFLINLLNELEFESHSFEFKKKNKIEYTIRIPRRKVKKFLDYIGACPVSSYNYKWHYREPQILRKKVLQFDLNGNLIRRWDSAWQVKQELGYDNSGISQCCRGKYKTSYGYIWRFA